DLPAFYAWAGGRPVIGELAVRLAGFRPPLAPDPFESLVTSITAQQVSLFAASAIRNRLVERYGRRAGRAYAFPARERLARASEEELVALGFSRRKAEYVLGLARSDVDLDGLAALDDDEVRARVTAIRGLGSWTAEWFLARHLARPRAWPAGDLGLRKASALLYGLDVHELGGLLDPFQNLSAHYLLTGMRVAWGSASRPRPTRPGCARSGRSSCARFPSRRDSRRRSGPSSGARSARASTAARSSWPRRAAASSASPTSRRPTAGSRTSSGRTWCRAAAAAGS